jgi:hypothetical protein
MAHIFQGLTQMSCQPHTLYLAKLSFRNKRETKTLSGRVPVAHAYNPSYSGRRDQKDHGSKSDWANSLQDPISKKPITKKKGWWSGSRCRP